MPFTPLHMGPGAVFKVVGARHFSLIVFGASQVLIDLEPLIRILREDTVLHGPTHTYLGALVLAPIAAVIGRFGGGVMLRWWNRRLPESLARWRAPDDIAWRAAMIAAFVGTFSHVFFDSLMHADMKPLWPFAEGNALWHAISVRDLHWACLISGAIGGAVLLWRAIRLLDKRD